MDIQALHQTCTADLRRLCVEIGSRSVGSAGNRAATDYFARRLEDLGWPVKTQEFTAMDWETGGARLLAGGTAFAVQSSPYARGCDETGPLVSAASLDELEQADIGEKIVLLHGEIAAEQLMPKNFVFYNPETHQQIIALLERGAPKAVVCATGRNSSLAGGAYPFPLIEDGDFDIPSVYMTDVEGERLLAHSGETVRVISNARRIPAAGCNVIGARGAGPGRIVVTAHIDAKKGTPGAIDNATGVIVLLLLAERLADYEGGPRVELVALNGEDYYAVPGQMAFIVENQGRFGEMLVNINIDGAGYQEGPSAVSFYGLPAALESAARRVIDASAGLKVGPQWPQGDHSIFVQFGVPAVAVTSDWFSENMDTQAITHTPQDNPDIVDCGKVVEIAAALAEMIRAFAQAAR